MGAWDSVKDAGSWTWNHVGPGTFTPGGWIGGKLFGPTQADKDEATRKQLLHEQAAAAGNFAGIGEQGYQQLGADARERMDYLRSVANGQHSIAGVQLRQGLEQNQAALRSQAASAAPQNQAMAARTAMIQGGKLGAGLSGQQAIAGLQERRDAEQALAGMTMGMRGQDLQAALGSRQTATTGYGAGNAGTPATDPNTKAMQTLLSILPAMSDRRLKTNIEPADEAAKARLDGLQAYAYNYKDPGAYGRGPQLGVMAQDLERAGLKQAVVNTPSGKAVDTAKLTGANTAMLAALGKRVSELEDPDTIARKRTLLEQARRYVNR